MSENLLRTGYRWIDALLGMYLNTFLTNRTRFHRASRSLCWQSPSRISHKHCTWKLYWQLIFLIKNLFFKNYNIIKQFFELLKPRILLPNSWHNRGSQKWTIHTRFFIKSSWPTVIPCTNAAQLILASRNFVRIIYKKLLHGHEISISSFLCRKTIPSDMICNNRSFAVFQHDVSKAADP